MKLKHYYELYRKIPSIVIKEAKRLKKKKLTNYKFLQYNKNVEYEKRWNWEKSY
jgi:hypothetical protein